jgi:hypothetical protein
MQVSGVVVAARGTGVTAEYTQKERSLGEDYSPRDPHIGFSEYFALKLLSDSRYL